MSILLAGILLVNILVLAWIIRTTLKSEAKIIQVKRRIDAFFEVPNGDDKHSEFETIVAEISSNLAQSITMHIKATLMGMESGAKRNQKAVERAIMQDIVGQQNPLIAMAMKQWPTLGKKMTENPNLAQGLMQMFPGMAPGARQDLPASDNGHSPVEIM
jgi:hypothetical protein